MRRLYEHLLGLSLVGLSLFVSVKRSGFTFSQVQRHIADMAVKERIQLPSTTRTDAPNNKYAIYMTTHMSSSHIEFLTKCWPAALEKLPLLQQVDFLVYTSINETNSINQVLQDTLKTPHNKVLIYCYDNGGYSDKEARLQKQEGAVLAMVEPFLPSNRWFDEYEWVIRLNPDVLIRRDQWLLQTMHNPNFDAIFVDWRINVNNWNTALHTDFYAFRPKAINATAYIDFYHQQKKAGNIHAETHIYAGVEHIIEQGRMAWLPNVTGNFRYAYTGGVDCDVVHKHKLVRSCPNYFEA